MPCNPVVAHTCNPMNPRDIPLNIKSTFSLPKKKDASQESLRMMLINRVTKQLCDAGDFTYTYVWKSMKYAYIANNGRANTKLNIKGAVISALLPFVTAEGFIAQI